MEHILKGSNSMDNLLGIIKRNFDLILDIDQSILSRGKRVSSKDWVQRELFGEIHWRPHRKQIPVIGHEEDPVVGVKKIVTDLTIVKPRIERIPSITKSGIDSFKQQ